MPIQNEDQSIILDKLKKYLSIVSKKRPMFYHLNDVKNENENLEAACSGFVALWFYYLHRQKKNIFITLLWSLSLIGMRKKQPSLKL